MARNCVSKISACWIGKSRYESLIEFAQYDNDIFGLSDSTFRIWDIETREKLDKDRFRKGLGGVVEAYEAVASRLGLAL